MSVNKDLLERYHSDNCSAQECREIEEWLFNHDVAELEIGATEKQELKAAMWKEITAGLPADSKRPFRGTSSYYMWKGAIAASLVFIFSAVVVYSLLPDQTTIVNLNNNSAAVREVSTAGYTVSVAPNTTASINDKLQIIDLKGSLLISAEKDVELLLEGTGKKMKFKKGQTYIILNGKDGAKELIMVNKANLLDLPPMMQRQINTHFDI